MKLSYPILVARDWKVTPTEAAIIVQRTTAAEVAKRAVQHLIDLDPYAEHATLSAAVLAIDAQIIPRALLQIVPDDEPLILDGGTR